MDPTSFTLLRRLQDNNELAWDRFVELYAPLIFFWGRQQGLGRDDASELVQDVLKIVFVKLPDFQYDPNRRFRGWLRTIAVNKSRDYLRRNRNRAVSGMDEKLDTVALANQIELFEQSEYQAFLVRRALELLEPEFRDSTWQAFRMLVFDGKKGKQVAAELGISEGAVYVAKSRVCRRLRQELAGLYD